MLDEFRCRCFSWALGGLAFLWLGLNFCVVFIHFILVLNFKLHEVLFANSMLQYFVVMEFCVQIQLIVLKHIHDNDLFIFVAIWIYTAQIFEYNKKLLWVLVLNISKSQLILLHLIGVLIPMTHSFFLYQILMKDILGI